MGAVTTGFDSSQATATWDGERPNFSATCTHFSIMTSSANFPRYRFWMLSVFVRVVSRSFRPERKKKNVTLRFQKIYQKADHGKAVTMEWFRLPCSSNKEAFPVPLLDIKDCRGSACSKKESSRLHVRSFALPWIGESTSTMHRYNALYRQLLAHGELSWFPRSGNWDRTDESDKDQYILGQVSQAIYCKHQ